jgi:hypothetical protein
MMLTRSTIKVVAWTMNLSFYESFGIFSPIMPESRNSIYPSVKRYKNS